MDNNRLDGVNIIMLCQQIIYNQEIVKNLFLFLNELERVFDQDIVMSENSFANYFKNKMLPILSIVTLIFAVWYIFTVYLNSSIQIDAYERQKVDWEFSDLVRDTMSQKKPLLPAPHQIVSEMWKTIFMIKI